MTKLCKNEKFLNQPSGANCTGFLIAEDKLLTAGHCVSFDSDCEEFYWVFDLKLCAVQLRNFLAYFEHL